jgi:ABC-type multidrug transport system fused ATPase/permease subunit
MEKRRKNKLIEIGTIISIISALLPAIKIASENISFLKDKGPITLILALITIVLIKLDKKELTIIPSTINIIIVIKFIIENTERLKQINELYNCYAKYQYGILVMLLANLIIIISVIIENVNIKDTKEKINKRIKSIKEKISQKNNTKNIIKEHKKQTKKIERINKKENKHIVTKETTKDGKIKFNKLVVSVDNKPKKKKKNIKEKIALIKLKHNSKKIKRKNISITKYKDSEQPKQKNTKTYYIPIIDIRKWTRNKICCVNCGATVNANSEYCFLCNCKIKLVDKKTKIS